MGYWSILNSLRIWECSSRQSKTAKFNGFLNNQILERKLDKEKQQQINTPQFELWCYMRMLWISWIERFKDEDIQLCVQLPKRLLDTTVKKKHSDIGSEQKR